jgi:hypothetical protein
MLLKLGGFPGLGLCFCFEAGARCSLLLPRVLGAAAEHASRPKQATLSSTRIRLLLQLSVYSTVDVKKTFSSSVACS